MFHSSQAISSNTAIPVTHYWSHLRNAALLSGIVALAGGCSSPSPEQATRIPQQLQTDAASDNTWADSRVTALVAQMSLEEKISQLGHDAPAIERLGLPRYNYWNEALHGVMTGQATSFPSPIALGATWNPDLVLRVASAISDEARGIAARDAKGLTYWSPVINMLRDPRWGRYDESYTEDPYLMSRLGVAFVLGLQGSDPKYKKTIATPKHYALNNSEFNRHTGTSDIDERTLREYYLPAFEATVVEAGAFSVMSAYNRVNGVPASANTDLLQKTLREEWGFSGYVVSDCDAVSDMLNGHHWTTTIEEAAAKALTAGTDLNCGSSYQASLRQAVTQGLVDEAAIDRALTRVLRARFLLGEFDPPDQVGYRSIGPEVVESTKHAELALEAARQSIVLLKNDNGFLPLDRQTLRRVALVGPHASDVTLGSYSGGPSRGVSALSAITTKLRTSGVQVGSALGVDVTAPKDQAAFDAAVALARDADVAIVFAGTSLDVLREEMDRPDWALPGAQLELIQAVYAANPKTVLVLTTAGPLGVDWAEAHLPAIVTDFYAGQEQGTAIADVLFGDYSPSGKLSTTWYELDAQLPPIDDYDITKGRTYWYYRDKPLYAFGHGLSYTRFSYGSLALSPKAIAPTGSAMLGIEVTNQGAVAGDEVVQLYIRSLDASVVRAQQQLRGFSRVHLDPGASTTVTFTIEPKDLAFWDTKTHGWSVETGDFELGVGSSSDDIRERAVLTVALGGPVLQTGQAGNSSDAGSREPHAGAASADSQLSGPRSGCQCSTAGRGSCTHTGVLAVLALLMFVRRRDTHLNKPS